jgi:hypothetical protein
MTSASTVATATKSFELDDLSQGHTVIIAARWLLVVSGLMFLLYRPQSTAEVAIGVLGVLAIAVTNLWLHTRLITRQAIEPEWAYWASVADLAVISALVLVQGSASSKAMVFYYPAVLAFSLVFPPGVTALLTSGVLTFTLMLGMTDGVDERILVARLLSLAATALIGARYREVEVRRRSRRSELSIAAPAESPRIEAQEDIYYGQIVCIMARWFVIAGAVFLALYKAPSVAHMQRNLVPLLVLIAANFFLHARYLTNRPANALLLQLASALDVAVITALLLAGHPDFFVFYYPVALAFALVFVRRFALVFTGLAGGVYALLSVPGLQFNGDEETLAIRLVTLVGASLLATLYWRVQRARRLREAL